MSRSHKLPLATSPETLGNPFATLSAEGLPAGQSAPEIKPPVASAPKLGRVVLRRETAHRGGKTVVVVDDFASHISALFIEELASKIRKACGCGGTVHERTIELQGDQPAKVRAALEAEGFRVDGVR